MTGDPVVHNNVLDLDFYFDIGPELNHCLMKHDAFDYEFENFDSNYLQFVMSDRVPNCLLDAMERQDFFDYKVNSQWMYSNLGTGLFPITTGRFAEAYPNLQNKYGSEQELDFEFKLKRPRVQFGPTTGENVHF